MVKKAQPIKTVAPTDEEADNWAKDSWEESVRYNTSQIMYGLIIGGKMSFNEAEVVDVIHTAALVENALDMYMKLKWASEENPQ